MTKDKGKLEAIWLKTSRNGRMDPVDEIIAVKDRGLEGNADFDTIFKNQQYHSREISLLILCKNHISFSKYRYKYHIHIKLF